MKSSYTRDYCSSLDKRRARAADLRHAREAHAEATGLRRVATWFYVQRCEWALDAAELAELRAWKANQTEGGA